MIRRIAQRNMEVLIDDIPEEGLEIVASEQDAWLAQTTRDAAGEAGAENDRAGLALRIVKIEGNVTVEGSVTLTLHPPCDRCGKPFEECQAIPIHVTLAPLYESKRQQEREQGLGVDTEIVREDLEFGYYEGDRFDVEEIVREQIVLARPMKHLCKEDCAGLCGRCGKDLNEGPCGCPPLAPHGSFSALKSVKLPMTRKR